jgi:hypothetical protein
MTHHPTQNTVKNTYHFESPPPQHVCKSLRIGGQMEQGSLSEIQYVKSRGHDKSKVKSQLDVEVEVQETMDLLPRNCVILNGILHNVFPSCCNQTYQF